MNPHLSAALAAVVERIPPERVDQVWLFPPRSVGEKESGLAVLALLPAEAEAGPDADAGASPKADAVSDRREVWTLQYDAERLKGGKTKRADTLLEQATVPSGLLERIIDGVVRRLGGDADAPDVHEVGGDAARWADLLADPGDGVVDSGN
ncbi:MAG: hypothetical protein JWM27_381 [Gemmatimonadetes bacterium]|nr:hypothetical protein [Gemmatimonadota bacterium]